MKKCNNLIIGVDFGTDSCRALIVEASTGKEIAIATSYYKNWSNGLYCNPNKNQYRHHPIDYLQSLEEAISNALLEIPSKLKANIKAIGIDTTASTIAVTDNEGNPLALLPEFAENPNAMFLLWKDHTAMKEAEEINSLARKWPINYTSLSGGDYSLEWFWAKILHILRKDEKVRERAYSAIELCDWLTAHLTGILKPEKVKRSRCAAGHKCMWAEEWGGYPSEEFLAELHPQMADIRSHLPLQTYTNDQKVGTLSTEWASKLGLSTEVVISAGIVDAHAAAIGAGIKPGTMVKIIGTSTCDIVVAPKKQIEKKGIPGISGQVDGSVLPGLIGIEAGQAAFGDVYAWFKKILSWTINELDLPDKNEIIDNILLRLNKEANKIPIEQSTLVSLDWLNGRRSPHSDPTKKGIISGITLATSAGDIFKSLVEATAFGSKAILDHYRSEGIEINDIICVGGIPQKSPYVMQTLCNILGVPIKVAQTEQAGALGAAMSAATAANVFSRIEEAQEKMGSQIIKTFYPDIEIHRKYMIIYEKYNQLGTLSNI